MTDARRPARVDVLMPVRSPAPWLGKALQSVVDQTYDDWSLLVVMDGFSQEVQDACHALGEERIRVEVLPAFSGLVTVLNRGLQASDAEFVARLDADDVCKPDRLAVQAAYLAAHPECVAVGTGAEVIDENGAPSGMRAATRTGPVTRQLRWRCPIVHPSVMMRRQAVVDAGGYSSRARHAEDYELWLRLGRTGEIHDIGQPLLQYRVHGGQVTASVTYAPETVEAIRHARVDLAQSRGESVLSARLRQATWVAWNRIKGRIG
ncbi:MAG: glycosyltransferase [Candidatus Nanopelagicales bacterium]